MKKLAKSILILVLAVSLTALCACGSKNSSSAPNNTVQTVVKLGVVGENNEHWEPVIEKLAAEGITLELVKFGDYKLPNQALADGEIDLNSFQHYAFFNNEVKTKSLPLTAIGETIIAPLGLYSDKIKAVSEIKAGDSIAIPSDPTNGGRSLKVLESAGLIKVDPAAGYMPEVANITENPLNIKIIQVEAAQTPSLLPDVAAAIINGSHAVDHGFTPESDAIYLETAQTGSDNPYINIIAARAADKDKELYKHVVELFQSADVKNIINEAYKGAYLPAWS